MFRYEVVNQKLKLEGRTREWFANQCIVPRGSMDLYLSGHRQPSIELLARMAGLLKLRIQDLVADPKEAAG
jgi:hypothetical protein